MGWGCESGFLVFVDAACIIQGFDVGLGEESGSSNPDASILTF